MSYPFFHADRIRTPTLFLCGEKDFNVPIAGVEQMHQALRSLGVRHGRAVGQRPLEKKRGAARAAPLASPAGAGSARG